MPGSYTAAAVSDENVIAAAEFAVSEESKKGNALTLVSVDAAETQVVAGMNYRVRLTVKDAGNSRKAEAVVYRNLEPNLSLTAWNWK
jgi:transcription elongation GreA/GreB family factor